MVRLIWLSVVLMLSGCAAVTTVAAIPGFVVEGVISLFQGKEESLPVDMKHSLIAVQKGLRAMDLHVDLMEPLDEGYAILFATDKLDGNIALRRQTPRLTTIYVQVHNGMFREKSVESAILEQIQEEAEKLRPTDRFDFRSMHHLREKPTINSRHMGWFRPGARLEVKPSDREGWLKIKLPSKKIAYLKGSVAKPLKKK